MIDRASSNYVPFFARAFLLGIGQLAAQLVFIASTPVLTRIYGPELFGLAIAFYAIAVLIGIVASLRLDLGIVLAPNEESAVSLFWAAVAFAAAFCALLAFVVISCKLAGINLASFHPVLAYSTLMPLMGFAYTVQVLLLAVANRHRRYGLMSAVLVLGSLGTVLYAFAVDPGGFIGNGLVEGRVFGTLLLAVAIGLVLWRVIGRRVVFGNAGAFKQAIIENKRFPIYNVPYSGCEALSREWFAIIALAFQQAELAGYFVIVRLVLITPIALASTAMGQVFFRDAVDAVGTSSLEKKSLFLWSVIAGSVAAFFAVLPWHAPALFAAVFGEAWGPAGLLAAIYAPAALMAALTGFPERLYEIASRQDLSVRIIAAFLLIKTVLLTAAFGVGASATFTLSINSVIDFAYFSAYLAGLVHVANFHPGRVTSAIAKPALFASAASSLSSFGAWLWLGPGLSAAAAAVGAAALVALASLAAAWRLQGR